MAITSQEKRGRLEDAYALSAGLNTPTSLRAKLRSLEQAARAAINGGSIQRGSANGHAVEFAEYGPGQITQTELVQLYREIIDAFDDAFLFLTTCAKVGVDAFVAEMTCFPSETATVNPANVLDTTGRFANLCLQFGVTAGDVIGTTVNDKTVFLWLMFHEVACTEARSDYTFMRVAEGSQGV